MVNRRDHDCPHEPGERSSAAPHPRPGIEAGAPGISSGRTLDGGAGDAGPGIPDEALAAAWQRRARSVFDDSVERTDAHIRSKLTRARYAALDELRACESRWRWLRLPVAGLTAAAVAAVAVLVWNDGGHGLMPGELPLEDMELVAEADSLEMLQDVEFYAWLGQQR